METAASSGVELVDAELLLEESEEALEGGEFNRAIKLLKEAPTTATGFMSRNLPAFQTMSLLKQKNF